MPPRHDAGEQEHLVPGRPRCAGVVAAGAICGTGAGCDVSPAAVADVYCESMPSRVGDGRRRGGESALSSAASIRLLCCLFIA